MQDNEGVCLCASRRMSESVCGERAWKRERIRAMMSCLFLLLYDHVLRSCLAGRFLQTESVAVWSSWSSVRCPADWVRSLLFPQAQGALPFVVLWSGTCALFSPPSASALPYPSLSLLARSSQLDDPFHKKRGCREKIFLQLLQLYFLIPPPVEEREERLKRKVHFG